MNKLLKYYNIYNIKWFFSILCIGFGFLCYAAAYDPEGIGDELVFLLAFTFAVIIYFVFDRLFERTVTELKIYFRDILNGNFTNTKDLKGLSDFVEINEMQKIFSGNLNEVKNGILELEKNNLNFEITNRDGYILKESVHNLQHRLIEIKKEEEQNNWINIGLAQFVDILRTDGESIEQLGRKIISSLAKYTNSNQAGLFILDKNGDYLNQVAFYAYDRDKFTEEQIPKGFGLLWQCLFEKKPIHIKEIPEQYIKVSSGLGDSNPKSLLMTPLLLEGETFGVIELASFNNFDDYVIDFIQKLAESIAATIASARTSEHTQKLLDESKIKTQELSTQEEEMRQNMEEMQSTQEEMIRIQKKMALKDYNMKALLDSSSDTFFAIDFDYKILVVNKTLQESFRNDNITLEEGMTIFNCIPKDQHSLWKKRYDKCLRGEDYTLDSEKNVDDKITYYRAYYKSIWNDDNEVIGCSVRTTDISEYNQIGLDLMDKSMEVMKLEDEISTLKNNSSEVGSSSKKVTSPKITKAIKELQKLKKK